MWWLCDGEFWLFYIFMCVCLTLLEKMEMCQNVRLGALAFFSEFALFLRVADWLLITICVQAMGAIPKH
jgi:hypothetical protein